MRYIEGKCKRCGTVLKFEIGNMTFEEAWKKIEAIQSFECPGYHVYIAGIVEHYEWSNIKEN